MTTETQRYQKKARDTWLAALRDGSHDQGVSVLRNTDDQFCCLGVLCDVVPLGEWRQVPNDYGGYWEFVFNDEFGVVPSAEFVDNEVLAHTLGLPRTVEAPVETFENDLAAVLMNLNDGEGWTFTQIADYIESLVQDD